MNKNELRYQIDQNGEKTQKLKWKSSSFSKILKLEFDQSITVCFLPVYWRQWVLRLQHFEIIKLITNYRSISKIKKMWLLDQYRLEKFQWVECLCLNSKKKISTSQKLSILSKRTILGVPNPEIYCA